MFTRRAVLQMSVAACVLGGQGRAQDRFDQKALLAFPAFGDVTLMHISDIQGQLVPAYYRAPDDTLGIGPAAGDVPHLTGEDFRIRYGIGGATPMDYALTHEGFTDHARSYGKMGGLAHVATVLNGIRQDRPEAILLVGGNAVQGSFEAARTQGQAVRQVLAALRPDVSLTRSVENVDNQGQLSQYVNNAEYLMRKGIKIAVISHAKVRKDIVNIVDLPPPDAVQGQVDEAKSKGADVVVCLSQGGFDHDRQLAQDVRGVDVILSGHSHHALPEPVVVGQTHIIASGGHGKFVSRIDLKVEEGAVKGLQHKLIPIFAEIIAPDPKVAAVIANIRAPFTEALSTGVATSEALLYRRGTLGASWDRVLCDALLAEQDVQIALCPGVRWGRTVLPGQGITRGDIHSVTAGGIVQREVMTGKALKTVLEDAADAVFSPDPYRRDGNDMLRTGGMAFGIDPRKPKGARIVDMTLLPSGAAVDAGAEYTVARWGLGRAGIPLHDVLEDYLRKRRSVWPSSASTVALVGG